MWTDGGGRADRCLLYTSDVYKRQVYDHHADGHAAQAIKLRNALRGCRYAIDMRIGNIQRKSGRK